MHLLLGVTKLYDGGRHPDRGSGLGLRRSLGAFSTEHERQRCGPPRQTHGQPRRRVQAPG